MYVSHKDLIEDTKYREMWQTFQLLETREIMRIAAINGIGGGGG